MRDLTEYLVGLGLTLALLIVTYSILAESLTRLISGAFNFQH